jgi:glycosyltransferase involved in cell wall biosynthesis
MQAIHQLVAGFIAGDAITNEAVALQALFRKWGYSSDIFCEKRKVNTELRAFVKDISELHSCVKDGDIAVLHLSIGSSVNDAFLALNCCKRIVRFHNITPPIFFRGINEMVAAQSEMGYRQLHTLSTYALKAIAVSKFNEENLKSNGYRNVEVIPLLLDDRVLYYPPDRDLVRELKRDGYENIIFIGRGVPNKRIEDLLCFFYYLKLCCKRKIRLVHIGSYIGFERYQMYVEAIGKKLGLKDFVMKGAISQNELAAYYKMAKLFMCMSEHEGFCIPLLESMAYSVPVMAYASSAIPETMKGAGVLFLDKNWHLLAEMASLILQDERIRSSIIEKENQRWQLYKEMPVEKLWKTALQPYLE